MHDAAQYTVSLLWRERDGGGWCRHSRITWGCLVEIRFPEFEDSDGVAALRWEPGWTFRELEADHWPIVSVTDEPVAQLAEIGSELVRPWRQR
jgi:hypothetical protein